MDVLWLLIVIPVVVYVLSALARGATPPKAGDEPADRTRREGARRTDPTPTDVERFLAEINRRRGETEREEAPTPRPQRPKRREGVARERPARAVPVVRRASDEEVRRLPSVQPVAPDLPLPRADEIREAVKVPLSSVASSRPTSPVITELLPLLRSPKGQAIAIVLKEVFGPPRCRRRG